MPRTGNLSWIVITGDSDARGGCKLAELEAYVVGRSNDEIAIEWVEFSPSTIRALLAPTAI
jgi:hypothetical protein